MKASFGPTTPEATTGPALVPETVIRETDE